MGRYRKKPVVIDAVQVVTKEERYERRDIERPVWLAEAINSKAVWWDMADGGYYISTLEGTMKANLGDWIIRGVKGELYPCKPDIFAATYDPA